MDKTIIEKLDSIERYAILGAKNVLNSEECALLLGRTKTYVYRLTQEKKIPYYKPNGGGIYFDKAEVETWMKQGRKATTDEIKEIAHERISRRMAKGERV